MCVHVFWVSAVEWWRCWVIRLGIKFLWLSLRILFVSWTHWCVALCATNWSPWLSLGTMSVRSAHWCVALCATLAVTENLVCQITSLVCSIVCADYTYTEQTSTLCKNHRRTMNNEVLHLFWHTSMKIGFAFKSQDTVTTVKIQVCVSGQPMIFFVLELFMWSVLSVGKSNTWSSSRSNYTPVCKHYTECQHIIMCAWQWQEWFLLFFQFTGAAEWWETPSSLWFGAAYLQRKFTLSLFVFF